MEVLLKRPRINGPDELPVMLSERFFTGMKLALLPAKQSDLFGLLLKLGSPLTRLAPNPLSTQGHGPVISIYEQL